MNYSQKIIYKATIDFVHLTMGGYRSTPIKSGHQSMFTFRKLKYDNYVLEEGEIVQGWSGIIIIDPDKEITHGSFFEAYILMDSFEDKKLLDYLENKSIFIMYESLQALGYGRIFEKIGTMTEKEFIVQNSPTFDSLFIHKYK